MLTVAKRSGGLRLSRSLALAAMLMAPVVGAQGDNGTATLLSALTSPNMWIRRDAFTHLDGESSVWARPGMAPVLLRLLKTEDAVIAKALRQKHAGVSEVYGESYGEYTSDVLERCLNFCDPGVFSTYVVEAMRVPQLRSTFNDYVSVVYDKPRFTAVDRARFVTGVVESIGDSTSTMVRIAALSTAHALLASPHTTATDRIKLHLAARDATNDRYPDIRVAAVACLGEVADTADVPLLRRVAQEDTSHTLVKGHPQYRVRVAAQAALSAMLRPNP